jgi:ABC-type phosphate transport system auxiliary subunit
MLDRADAFVETMNTLHAIRMDIERLSEERREILHKLSEGHDPELVAERGRLEERIARLWDEYRAERARLRFGERDVIIARARHEERLERAAA